MSTSPRQRKIKAANLEHARKNRHLIPGEITDHSPFQWGIKITSKEPPFYPETVAFYPTAMKWVGPDGITHQGTFTEFLTYLETI